MIALPLSEPAYYALRSFSFTLATDSNHHALCILSDQLVREGLLLDAATAVEDNRLRDEAADPEHPAVDHVKLE